MAKLRTKVAAGTATARTEGKRLKHQRLRSQLLGEIAVGTYRPGDALPTELQLAEMMQVSRTTVRQTLGDLEQQGLVRRVQGKGTFVTAAPAGQAGIRTAPFALLLLDGPAGYYPGLLTTFEQAANQVGRSVIICNSQNDINLQGNHLLRLLDQRVAGVVLNPCSREVTPSYHVRVLQDAGIPVVQLCRLVPDVSAPMLAIPAVDMGFRAGKVLTDAGHRCVGFVASHRSDLTAQLETGVRRALNESEHESHLVFAEYGDMDLWIGISPQEHRQSVEGVIQKMLSEKERPTALFFCDDVSAELAYVIATGMGLRVPEDLSIICEGGKHREGAILSQLTAVCVDEHACARKAVQLLLEMGEGKRAINNQEVITLALDLKVGRTVGPPADLR